MQANNGVHELKLCELCGCCGCARLSAQREGGGAHEVEHDDDDQEEKGEEERGGHVVGVLLLQVEVAQHGLVRGAQAGQRPCVVG